MDRASSILDTFVLNYIHIQVERPSKQGRREGRMEGREGRREEGREGARREKKI